MRSFIAIFLAWLSILSSCSESRDAPTQTGPEFSLRFGHDMPEASAQHVAALRFAELLHVRSKGAMEVSVHPAQSLGNDHAMIDMARKGELDFIVPPTAKLALLAPAMQLLDLPFLLSDAEARAQILDGRVGETLLASLEKHQLVGLQIWDSGLKQFTANRELRTPKDFVDMRFRVMKSEMLQDQFAALGARSVAIDFSQTRIALKNGAVDGQENPLTPIASMGFHEVQSHLIISNHGYLGQALIVSATTMAALPKELQLLVRQVAEEVTVFQRQEAQRLADASLATIRAAGGTTIVELSDDEREALRVATHKVIEAYRMTVGTSLIEQCLQIIQSLEPVNTEELVIGLDADLTGNSALSGLAIRRGIELALDEINGAGGVLERKLVLRTLDNSMVTARGLDNLTSFAALPNLVAVVGGISSTVTLAELPLIHEKKILFLDPWAAATKIVDNGYDPNFVFRVSVRDDYAGLFLVDEARNTSDSIALMLVDNPWGHSNHEVMLRVLESRGLKPTIVEYFDWRTTDFRAKIDRIYQSGAGVLLYVGNGVEAAKIITDIANRPSKLPIVSHWGISGSELPAMVGDALGKVDIRVLQTSSFIDRPSATGFVESYSKRYATLNARDIVAPVGTAHAYDLVHLLAKAIEESGSTDMSEIRDAMEKLGEHRGLVKTYAPPFTSERHDALDASNYILTRYEGKALVPVRR
tara:strand:- start:35294 stop:37399 length:2106 start_codon:yes stop_codon:yes gene_type:complete